MSISLNCKKYIKGGILEGGIPPDRNTPAWKRSNTIPLKKNNTTIYNIYFI
jgi:hypothetical protein